MAKVPVLCVLGSWGRMLSEVAVEGLDHAVKAIMANGFLNLLHFADDEDGNARIRRIVDYPAPTDPRRSPPGYRKISRRRQRAGIAAPAGKA